MVDHSAIKTFCNRVAEEFHPERIILFGSYAYGRPTEDSDVDLLVVLPRTRQHGERMSVKIRHAIPRSFPLDLIVRTPREVEEGVRRGDTFLEKVMAKGEVMYEANHS